MQLSPHVLCQHLIETASAFNSFYQSIPVLKADKKLKEARLALVAATAQVMQNGLHLLGIETLERM